ncbi:MAG: FRG domain-containing protein, partial [Actinomycetota bacterium]
MLAIDDSLATSPPISASYIEATGINRPIYRGHGRSTYDLVPPVFRTPNVTQDVLFEEQQLLETFKRRSRPYLNDPPSEDLDWLVLARHYGVPTRLLDWSTSPAVALWFAVADHDDADGELIMAVGYRDAGLVENPFDLQLDNEHPMDS